VNLRAPLRAIHLAGGAVNNVEFDGGAGKAPMAMYLRCRMKRLPIFD